MKKIFLLAFPLLLSATVFAQQANYGNSTKPIDKEKPLDGHYKKDNLTSATVTPYANLREADVMSQKRIYREIDLRE